MENSIFVLVNLTEQGANLHVRLAAVLEHLQLETGLVWVVEVIAQVVRVEVVDTSFQADRALLENAQFLVAHGHVVQGQQEYKLVARYFVSLDLLQHGLRLLQQN